MQGGWEEERYGEGERRRDTGRVGGGEIQGGWEEERYREGERRRDTGRVRGQIHARLKERPLHGE